MAMCVVHLVGPNWPHESMYPTPSVLQLVSVESDDFAIPRAETGSENEQVSDIALVCEVNAACAKW